MRVHIIAPGFTKSVFERAFDPSAVSRKGIDKLIAVHTPIQEEDIRKKVEETLKAAEDAIGIKAELYWLREKTFIGVVGEIQKLLERFGKGDQIYLHLEGGERHVGLAMAYASFLTDKSVKLVVPTEYGKTEKEHRFEEIPPLPAYRLSKAQRKYLQLVAEKEGQSLTEISARVNPKDPASAAPGVLRQLKALCGLGLTATQEDGKKRYYLTSTGRLFL